jgi:hypothetical protein
MITAYILITVSVLIAGVWIGFTFADTIAALGQVLRDGLFPPDKGRHISAPGAPATTLLGPAETVEHADAMWQASEPYLPPSPAGENPYPWHVTPQEWQSYVNAGRAVEPVRTGEHPPWTGSQPALTPEVEAAELDRQRYIRARLDECGPGATADDLREILDALRQPSVTESVSAWRPGASPVYGEAPVAGVLEAERLSEVMLP